MFWWNAASAAQSAASVRVKLCGLTTEEAVDAAVRAGADMVGFVFYPRSPRNVSFKEAARLAARVPEPIATVAVTVNFRDDSFQHLLEHFTPHYLQLHGQESPERVAEVKAMTGLPVIKALSISHKADVDAAYAYDGVADILLFDAKPPSKEGVLPGGNGISFDWDLLKEAHFTCPWILSGGLSPENVADAIAKTGAAMVDASSSLESAPGIKDNNKINQFIEVIHSL